MANNKKEKIDFKHNLKIYFSFLKKYKLYFIITIILILFIEAGSVIINYLFKILIDNGTKYAAREITKIEFISILKLIAFVFVALAIARSLFRWLSIHYMNRFEVEIIKDLKTKFFNHILGMSYDFHTTHKAGSLIARLTRGGRAVEEMSDIILFNFAPMVFQLFVAAAALIYFDLIPALIIMLILLIFIAFNLVMNRLQQSSNVKAINQEDYEKANVSDMLLNVESIKYFGKDSTIKEKMERIFINTSRAFCKNWDYYTWLASGQNIIIALGTFLTVFFPLQKFLSGKLSLGTLVFIYTTYGVIIGYAHSFVHGLRRYYKVMVDFQSLFQYEKIKNEIKDKPNARKAKITIGEIEFDNISFSYKGRKIFENFSLKIPKNKKIALVGPSGAGKTTLIKLLYRLYDVDKGSIRVDGVDIRDFKQESFRSELSIVPQECILFDDTIYNNIAFSKPGATKKEVMQAIKLAQLDKIIKDFPDKENTIVGERGIKLSGGEKQRVSIARALLANKKILVLDEATSSLDSETEHEIQLALQELMKGRTTIIIAHRLSTIMKADEIVVLDKGKIIDMGTHKELISRCSLYKKLWSLQRGGYIK